MTKLTGLIAATYSPMNEDGSLRLEPIEALSEHLVRGGVTGAFLCGTTGEFSSLSVAERKAICERWASVRSKGFHIVQHVGGLSVEESRDLAAHAQTNGADAFSAIAPYFFKPSSVQDLVAYCKSVASAAPDLPFYYYHLPALTGVHLPMIEFLRLASSQIPNLAGIKFSHTDLADLAECQVFEGGRFDLLFGCDEILLAGLTFGCEGAVGSTYGFVAPLYQAIRSAFEDGDIKAARRLQTKSAELVSIFRRFGGHRAMKSVMKIVGIDCGPVRSPLCPLSDEEFTVFSAELAAFGFDDCRRNPSELAS